MSDRALHPARRLHLDELTGPLGIWQHARGMEPDEAHGYCTDDVARALLVDLHHAQEPGWHAVRDDALRSFAFLQAAFDHPTGTFRNFRSADGTWLGETASQDSQGRALLALGAVIAHAPERALVAGASSLFEAALPGASELTALRACSSAILGCDAALAGSALGSPLTNQGAERARRLIGVLAGRLAGAFAGIEPAGAWPWPEPILTYENALLPHAMIGAGVRLGDDALTATGLHVLDWLIGIQTGRSGEFSPVGNRGWWPRGGPRSRFDQQPIEATATILAAERALSLTGDARYRRAIESAYGWFLGDNDAGLMVADPGTGGCRDGLSERRVNGNQGAESTLMWQLALEAVRRVRAANRTVAVAWPRGSARPVSQIGVSR